MMKNQKETRSNFDFEFKGYGHYKVTYTSPVTGKKWSKTISDMEIIDKTRNEDEPTQGNLRRLKRVVKAY